MNVIGLDIGSRTIALVHRKNKRINDFQIIETGTNPLDRCQSMLSGREYDVLAATGYGRHLAAAHLAELVLTEIKAYTLGTKELYSDVRTVVDIGGQDSKVISLTSDGAIKRFEMNDRCAAGTGRFLEAMAQVMSIPIDEFGFYALNAEEGLKINSMCTVFAESEVISLIARNEDGSRIARGLHESISSRIASMVRRVGYEDRVVFAGGVAKNPCMQKLLAQKLDVSLSIPEEPQIMGALGAAIYAEREK
jgi:predicted CoA-substrate-specific enzyme activase